MIIIRKRQAEEAIERGTHSKILGLLGFGLVGLSGGLFLFRGYVAGSIRGPVGD